MYVPSDRKPLQNFLLLTDLVEATNDPGTLLIPAKLQSYRMMLVDIIPGEGVKYLDERHHQGCISCSEGPQDLANHLPRRNDCCLAAVFKGEVILHDYPLTFYISLLYNDANMCFVFCSGSNYLIPFIYVPSLDEIFNLILVSCTNDMEQAVCV